MASQDDYAAFRKGFNGGTDPLALANQAAKGYQQALPANQPGSTQEEQPSQEQAMHMISMQQRAEEAAQKYREENNLDENLNPLPPKGAQ